MGNTLEGPVMNPPGLSDVPKGLEAFGHAGSDNIRHGAVETLRPAHPRGDDARNAAKKSHKEIKSAPTSDEDDVGNDVS